MANGLGKFKIGSRALQYVDFSMSDVTPLLGPIIGTIYSRGEESFNELSLSESALKAIHEAGDLYNSGRRDHAFIEMFIEIEKVLKKLSQTKQVSVEPDAAGYIHALRKAGLVTECDLHILHALRCYRNLAAHPTNEFQHAMADTLLILAIPMLSRLERQLQA
jgi:hypothetical protein